ncbi:MAG: hypothetical protein Q9182_006651 [Xanthomendoza sp. 2 TL-2023]
MDPLSITASVVGLITLTAKIMQITKVYCHEARNAKAAANELLVELDLLHLSLSQLDKMLKNDTTHLFSDTLKLVAKTHACRNELNKLHDKLNDATEHSLHRFRWPLSSSEHQKTMQELRVHAFWIHFALTIDSSSSMTKISAEVIDLSNTQLGTREAVEQVKTDTQIIHSITADRSSLVIDHLCQKFSKDPIPVSYIYFDYKDQDSQSLEAITASLLQQVADVAPAIPSAAASLYHRFTTQNRFPEQQSLVRALLSTYGRISKAFIVIDAIDECDSRYRTGVLELIKLLQGHARILITSRPHSEDISTALKSSPQIPIMAHSEDLERYIDQKIDDSDACDEMDHKFRGKVVRKIIQSAQEMFLLAVLHVQTILDEPSVGDMEEALDRLPHNLPAAFDETMDRIKRQPESRIHLALPCLMLLSYARRPLQLSELIVALAVRPGLASVNIKYRSTRKKVMDSCHGLVTVDKESQMIRLVHYSAHGFLLSRTEQEFVQGERLIAELCIAYQMMGPFSSGCCRDEQQIIDRLDYCPFIAYAARYWGAHVLATSSSQINELTLDFLRAGPQRASSYQTWQYTKGRREEYWEADEADSCNGLHLAAMFRLHDIAVELLPECPVDASTPMGTTALIKAASCGSTSLVGLLMDMNADFSRNNWYGKALHAAAEANEVGCIHELLDRGVDVNLLDQDDRGALACATQSGNMEAMNALLERGANVNHPSRPGHTPLFVALACAQEPRIIQTLLVHHADPNIPSNTGVFPMHLAAEGPNDREVFARLLLDNGADIEAQNKKGSRPIHLAAAANNQSIPELIVFRDATIDAQSQDGATALYRAARFGHEYCVRWLLMLLADPDLADNEGFTPLRYAQTLLDAGAKQDNHAEDQHQVSGIESKSSLDSDDDESESMLRDKRRYMLLEVKLERRMLQESRSNQPKKDEDEDKFEPTSDATRND